MTDSNRPQRPPEVPLFDAPTIETLVRMTSHTSINRAADLFIEETHKRMAALYEAMKGGQTDQAILQAHTMRSSAATFGLMRLAETAWNLEDALIAGNETQIKQNFDALPALAKTSMDTLVQAMKDLTPDDSAPDLDDSDNE